MDGYRVVLVTAPDENTAVELAKALVGEQLAACANVIPGVRSIYRWQGKIEDDAELLIIFKTKAELIDRFSRRVAELHPYDLPEVIALPIQGGLDDYLNWIGEQTRSGL